jgi:4'-phosphopantetheinyl transferase
VAAIAQVDMVRVARVLADLPPDPAAWLSESEQARLAQLRHAGRRDQYLAGHWLARVLLARAFGGVAIQWQLRERKSQAPEVQGHAHAHVSISHAGEWVAAAVADGPVGIDLEERTRVLDASIEPLLRNADEAPGSLDADARLLRWVAKEAWIKRGGGSALPGRLEQLQLQAVARERADVCVYSHAEFHLALAVAHGCRVQRPDDPVLAPTAAYSVSESP